MVKIKNFSMCFGLKNVINDLSFNVQNGEFFAFLGPNGSGKTTTIRSLLGIYKPTKGSLLINDEKYTNRFSKEIGYLPEERGLYLNMKVLDTLIFFGKLKGLKSYTAKKWAIEYLDKVGLGDKINLPVKKLSSGQQQKIQLGVTIIHNPSLLILDEPTKGLDPLNRELLMQILKDLNKAGTTIIFSTHLMDEVEKFAHKVLMINNGVKALYGSVESIKEKYAGNSFYIKTDSQIVNTSKYKCSFYKAGYKIESLSDINPNQMLKVLFNKGFNISHFEKIYPSLEEIFISVAKNGQ